MGAGRRPDTRDGSRVGAIAWAVSPPLEEMLWVNQSLEDAHPSDRVSTGTARADLLIDQLQARVDNHQAPGKLVHSYGKRRRLAGLPFPFSVRRQRGSHP